MTATYTIPLAEGQDRDESIARGHRMEAAVAAGTLTVRKTSPERKGFVVVADPAGDLFEIDRRCYCPDWLLALCRRQIGG